MTPAGDCPRPGRRVRPRQVTARDLERVGDLKERHVELSASRWRWVPLKFLFEGAEGLPDLFESPTRFIGSRTILDCSARGLKSID